MFTPNTMTQERLIRPNTMTQKQLNNVLKLHEMWLKGQKGGKRADLSNQNLDRLNLSGAWLRKAKLDNASLIGANLKLTNFSEASLHGTVFDFANMQDAFLGGASAVGASFVEALLFNAYLVGTDLRNACLLVAHLASANLEDANIKGADFTNANFSDVSLPTGVYKVTGIWKQPNDSIVYDTINDRVIIGGWYDTEGGYRLESFKEFIKGEDLEPETRVEYMAAIKFFEAMRELRSSQRENGGNE